MNKELFQATSSSTARTTTSPIENDYTWIVNPSDPETATIVSFNGNIETKTDADGKNIYTTLYIPYMLGGKIITIIGPGAFQGKRNFFRVVIHSDILSIEAGAFSNCSDLKYIAFNSDSQLLYIKRDAFLNTNINNPIIPASVKRIEDGAFDTFMLKTVTFLGDCPTFTQNAFNTQDPNGNSGSKIAMLYFINSIGFSNPNDSKFFYVSNYKIKPYEEPVPIPETTSISITRYIFYFLLFVLLIVSVIFIYVKYFKKGNKYEVNEDIE
jgi:hypothetical protein